MKSAMRISIQLFALLTMLALSVVFLGGCADDLQTKPDRDEKNEFVLNTRTGKIHSPNCSAVGQMKEKNKKVVSDNLSVSSYNSMLEKDYTKQIGAILERMGI